MIIQEGANQWTLFLDNRWKNWPRAEAFYYYSQMAPTSYSITVKLRSRPAPANQAKANQIFSGVFICGESRVVRSATGVENGGEGRSLGYWDYLNPV